jgi:hypothetical protein
MGTAGWAQAAADRARIRTVLRAPPDWRAPATTSVPGAAGAPIAAPADIVRTDGHALDPAQPRAGEQVETIAKYGISGSRTSLPYLERVQASFGAAHDLSSISVHQRTQRYPPGRTCGSERPSPAPAPRLPIQAKLKVGAVNDPLEREADVVADQVMRMPTPQVALGSAPPQLSRKCAGCEEEEKLQRKEVGPQAASEAAASVHEVLRSPGQPLDAATRAYFEPRFGQDFSQVRVHTDARAAESARAVNALAYTAGRNVVFAAGQYSPNSNAGQQLIAHELAHVLQQSNGAARDRATGESLAISVPDDAFERQADQPASRVLDQPAKSEGTNHALSLRSGAGNSIQRKAVGSTRPAALVSRGAPIVEDSQTVAAGQMHRSEFLTTLRDALIRECDIEFAEVGRTAKECPYILRTIGHYASGPLSALLRVIRHFAHPPAGADAHGLIRSVTQRARVAARNIAKKSDRKVQAKSENSNARLPAHDPVTIRSQLGSGRPLDTPVRGNMERSFDTSFAAVRIHDDVTAARFNKELGAHAFAVGNDIAFGAGEYQPGTATGDALIAHELAHTIQQGSRAPEASGSADDQALEQQADRAASAATHGREAATLLEGGAGGIRVQRLPAVVAGALIVAEATPEIVVLAEVGTEFVVVDSALVVAADVAVPAALDVALPAAVDVALPTAVEATTVASTSTAVSTAATTLGVGVAATTLSSDSPTQSDPQRTCLETTGWPICGDLRTIETVAESFAIAGGVAVSSMNCEGFSSIQEALACGGQPGVNWHCTINDSDFVISLVGCSCCNVDGSPGFEWHPHSSPGKDPNTSGDQRRREDTRRDRREKKDRDRQRRDRRDRGED